MKRYILSILLLALFMPALTAQNEVKFEFSDGIDAGRLKTKMEAQTSALLTAINKAAIDNTDINYSGIDIDNLASQSLGKTWNVVHFKPEYDDIVDHCIRQRTASGRLRGFQVRNIGVTMIPVDNTYDGPERRELVIDFGPNGKIEDVNFSMGMTEYSELIRKGEQLGDLDRRMQIIHWCEQFQNAYNKCDLPFMQRIFSDDAIIITGKITNKVSRSDVRLSDPVKVQYVLQTKQQYINNLAGLFKRAKYINVKFGDYKITRHPTKPNYYGVTLRQDFATNSYEDHGILFLVWDFTNEDEPKIHVRTWQPLTEQAFSLSDFQLP